MYVNPSIYKCLKNRCTNNKTKSIVELIRLYTGCTSSVLIHSSKIEKIYKTLKNALEKKEKLIPIDNYLRSCDKRKELIIGTTIPFLSSIRHENIIDSTIQLSKEENKGVELTQRFCSILRKELSIIPYNNGEIESLVEVYTKLVRIKEKKEVKRSDIEIIIEPLMKYAEKEEILMYKYRENLKDEEDNPQNKINEH